MGLLSFLKTANVKEVAETAKRTGGAKKQRNPNPLLLAIRLWRDGSVYPSAALVEKFDLEYKAGTVEDVAATVAVGTEGQEGYVAAKPAGKKVVPVENNGQGFDVIDSRAWSDYEADGDLLFIAPVKRGQAKIDLFGSTVFAEDGTPKSTVLEQGAVTFGKEVLLPLVKELYDIELSEERDFVDLIVTDTITEGDDSFNVSEAFSKKIMYFPKRITRGAQKGKDDYIRRENTSVYAFIPQDMLGNDDEPLIEEEVPEESEELA